MVLNNLSYNDGLLLSVIVPTYNHEKYIALALDSILMQKTSFNFEILVGDDASTDNTPAIIMEYVRKYPDRITAILRKENTYQNGNGPTNGRQLFEKAKGKYIIALEGDDFWTDTNKLQVQVDFLEQHPDYIGVAHNALVVGEDGKPNGEEYPECKKENYSYREFAKGLLPGQTATLMYRNIYRNDGIDKSILQMRLSPGDRLKVYLLLAYGKIFCIQKTMSCYRHVRHGGSSFSARNKYNFQKLYKWNFNLMNYAHTNRDVPKFAVSIAEYLFLRIILSGFRRNILSLSQFIFEFKKIKRKTSAVLFLFIYGFKEQNSYKKV